VGAILRTDIYDREPLGRRWGEGRVTMVVRRSRHVGRVGQLENPLLCRLRDRMLAMIPPKVQLRQLEEV
jgi:hypothetical protein